MNTRRDLLKTIAIMPVAAAAQQHAHTAEPLLQIAKSPAPKAFAEPPFRLLTRLVDLILPRSETPGAADAGVPFLIDAAAAANAGVKTQYERGLAELDALARATHNKPFVELTDADQIAILKDAFGKATSSLGQFLELVKGMTIDGYYTTREGLVQELGWHGNTYLASFPGCTHAEHQS